MKKKKCFVAWVLICSMLVFYIPSMASDQSENSKVADTTVDVEITLEYRQQQARTIFDMVNEFRTGENAWFWNEDNTTKTIYQLNELSALTYDYTLEEVAMQRAAEIALHYSHTRTNGERCFTAFAEAGYPESAKGENIAAGYPSPEAVFLGWREDEDDYAGQGHRRNMLSTDMTAIGIGYAYYNGVTYWTMELGSAVTQKTEVITDGIAKARISVLNSYIQSLSTEETVYTVACNDVIDVPEVHTQMVTAETWPKGNTVTGVIIEPEWTVADTAVAEVSNGKIMGKKVGTTTLTAKAGVETTQITLNVTGFTLTDTNVVLPNETFVYSGSEITPEPTVTYNGTMLEKGKDYIVSYKNNIEPGTEAAVIVTGIGNYSGEVTKNFAISTCAHNWDEGKITKEATCEEDGVKTITCKVCNETKTEVIPATGHNWDEGKITKEATCEEDGVKTITCKVCNETKTEVIPATGHNWDEGKITKEATCEEDGIKTITCKVCNETKTEVISATGHNWDEGKITKEATCKEDGVKTITCKVCNETKTEVIPATGHNYEEPVFRWTDDYSSAVADFSCKVCKDVHTVSAAMTIKAEKNATSYTAETVFNEKTYKENKRVVFVNEKSRVVISEDTIEIPKTLEKYSTKEEIVRAFIQEIEKKEGYSNKNMTVYDVQLQMNINGKWEITTHENFPKEGFTITIPYPEGTDRTRYDFVVTHMFTYNFDNNKAGDIETLAVIKTDEGLQCTVMSLSPISVAWKEIAVEKETTTVNKETTSSSTDNDESTSNNKETTTVKNQTTTNSIKTGDNTSIVLWIVVGLSAACSCFITGWRKHKKHLV